MTPRNWIFAVAALLGLGAAAAVPVVGSGYAMSLTINLLMFVALATAWALFSGPTALISLATVAFFGIGAYTVAVFGEAMPWPLVLLLAAVLSLVVALVVGLSTLRLKGIYFVIFTFGLSELIRQLVTWYEANFSGSVGRYVFLDITQAQIVWQLVALTAAIFIVGAWIHRSRLGLALRMIGDDETAAMHCGTNVTRVKLIVFAISAMFMALAGAIIAPRWTYLDASIAFSPLVSFQVVIMALLGGAARLYGPALGVIPLVFLFEYLSANFPNYFSILLGVTFMAIVYLVPQGIAGLLERCRKPAVARAGKEEA
ncbi:MAG: branched-chain amino acid ABC transporter permease [Pigmentiphaga sp.]